MHSKQFLKGRGWRKSVATSRNRNCTSSTSKTPWNSSAADYSRSFSSLPTAQNRRNSIEHFSFVPLSARRRRGDSRGGRVPARILARVGFGGFGRACPQLRPGKSLGR